MLPKYSGQLWSTSFTSWNHSSLESIFLIVYYVYPVESFSHVTLIKIIDKINKKKNPKHMKIGVIILG